MGKREIIQQVIEKLKSELDQYRRAALATHEDATHEENKAEDKYDTRGLEASYLAMGQARQAEEIQQSVQAYESLAVRDFPRSDPVSLGALVTVETRGRSAQYLVGPRAGGTEVEAESGTILVVTPQSPLGRQLMGRMTGDTLVLEIGGRRSEARIVSVA